MSKPYTLYVTFGMKYAREAHPRVSFAHPDGWLEVVLTDPPGDPREAWAHARGQAYRLLGMHFAFDYDAESFASSKHHYQLGCLARLTDGNLEVFREFKQTVAEV